MTTTTIPLIKGDKIDLETDYGDALPVNMTAVIKPIRGANGYMVSHPGIESFATGQGIDRGAVWNARQREHFRISGSRLISVDPTGLVSDLGFVGGAEQASLAYSFNTQGIVTDGKFFLYDGTTLSEVTDPQVGTPIDLTWIDNFYVLTDGENIYHTNIGDETTISPTQFDTSEFSPDPTLAVDKTSDDQLIVFDRYTTVYFIQRFVEDFAFQWIKGKSIKVGIVGTHCETELEGVFYILGGGKEESPSVHYLTAGTYISVATREVDEIIEEYDEAELATAVLETRSERKDRFILVRLPRDTLIFNVTIDKAFGKEFAWTILKSGFENDPWTAANGVYDPRQSLWVYGDINTSRIGKLNNDIGSQYGDKVEYILFSPLTNLEGMSIDALEVDTIPGHQVNNDEVTVSLSFTYDGVTYGKEWFQLYGEQYEYNQRYILNRLGYVRNFFGYKLRSITDEKLAFSLSRITYG
ncbi:MAG: packaged DNA stabilization protein [Nitrosomonadaceae bacterium]